MTSLRDHQAIWENRDEWASSAKSVETQAIFDDVLACIDLPLHPGSIRYLEEKGVTIPDAPERLNLTPRGRTPAVRPLSSSNEVTI